MAHLSRNNPSLLPYDVCVIDKFHIFQEFGRKQTRIKNQSDESIDR